MTHTSRSSPLRAGPAHSELRYVVNEQHAQWKRSATARESFVARAQPQAGFIWLRSPTVEAVALVAALGVEAERAQVFEHFV